MRRIAITALSAALAAVSLALASPAWSEEVEACGIVHELTREPLSGQRFWPLAEHSGRAFLDKKTCLVATTDVWLDPTLTLSDAMTICAEMGHGGPLGEMGWRIPTMAELTSLDGEEWGNQSPKPDLPPTRRNEATFWTMTEWPGMDNTYATVIYSAPTTLVRPRNATEKAGVWCVQEVRATGIK